MDVQLTRCSDGELVNAKIESLDKAKAEKLIDVVWWQTVYKYQLRNEKNKELDYRWIWGKIVPSKNHEFKKAVCVQTEDSAIQGAMVFEVNARSFFDKKEHAIYINYLATAPHNREKLVSLPKYRDTGSSLLLYAIAFSYQLGFGGRVNLDVADGEQFYSDLGFVKSSCRISMDGPGYELRSETAIELLVQRGLL